MSPSYFILFFILFIVTAILIGWFTRFHMPDNDTESGKEKD